MNNWSKSQKMAAAAAAYADLWWQTIAQRAPFRANNGRDNAFELAITKHNYNCNGTGHDKDNGAFIPA